MSVPILVPMVVYLAVVAGIGVWATLATKTSEDYLVGGHRLGIVPSVGTYLATYLSATSLIGGVGVVYNFGLAGNFFPMFYGMGATIGVLMAARYRRTQFTTPPEFYRIRYQSPSLQMIVGLGTIVALIFSLVGQFKACGMVWSVAIGRPYIEGLLIGSLIAMAYTAAGGFFAVAWTDVAQAVVFVVALIYGGIWVLVNVGGLSKLFAQASKISTPPFAGAKPTPQGQLVTLLGPYTAIAMFFNWMIWTPGVGTHPQYLVRAQSAASIPVALKKYQYSWPVLALLYFFLSVMAVGGRVLVPTMPKPMTGDWILPYLFRTYMHPVMAGVLLSGILAAGMSTIDSQLILCSSCGTIDVIKNIWPGASDTALILVGRLLVIAIGVISIACALIEVPVLLTLFGYSWGILATLYFAPTVFGLYWKRANRQGAYAAVLGGLLVFVFWQAAYGTKIAGIPPLGPGIVAGIILMVVVSLLTPPPPEESWKPFFPR